jgi:hypothetical protein
VSGQANVNALLYFAIAGDPFDVAERVGEALGVRLGSHDYDTQHDRRHFRGSALGLEVDLTSLDARQEGRLYRLSAVSSAESASGDDQDWVQLDGHLRRLLARVDPAGIWTLEEFEAEQAGRGPDRA